MKKKRTLLWIGLFGLYGALLGGILWQQQRPIPVVQPSVARVQYDLPIETHQIILSHNKYGDYLAGLLAQRNQDYDQTAQSFEAALENDPDNQNLKTSVYLLKAIRGDIESALPLAKELSASKRSELLTDYMLIAAALRQKDYVSAGEILEHKPAYGADGVLKPALSAWIAAGRGEREVAEQALLPLQNQTSDSLYEFYRGLIALCFNDRKAAEEAFKKMSAQSANGYPSLAVLPILRDFYTAQNQWQPGQPDYDRIMSFLMQSSSLQNVIENVQITDTITPEIGASVAFYDVSVALATMKLAETSLILNELALYLHPTALIPKVWAGELLESEENYQAANRIYDRIVDKPDVILMKQATLLITMDKTETALKLLEKLVQKRPRDARVYMLLGDAYAQLKTMDKAADNYTYAATLYKTANDNARAAEALLSLGSAYDHQKRFPEAEKALLESIQLLPNNPMSLNYLGYLWLDQGKNIDEAFNMVQQAAELAPDDPNIMDSLALGYYLKKDYDSALEVAEQAIDQISYSSIAYAHLGDIYAALGRKREARYQYRKALDLTSDITPELKRELEKKLAKR